MAGETATFDVTALAGFSARLDAARAALGESLAVANEEIVSAVESTIADLYGPRLAPKWQVDAVIGEGGELASVLARTEDKRVLFYEFGTRPHPIAAVNGRALAFKWRGAQAFYVRVQHPGTPAHNHREALKVAMGMAARETWGAAIQEALANA